MKEVLKTLAGELFASKKFAAMLVGLLVTLAVYPLTRWAGLGEAEAKELAAPLASKVVALVSAYLVGQGLADHGKEREKAKKRIG